MVLAQGQRKCQRFNLGTGKDLWGCIESATSSKWLSQLLCPPCLYLTEIPSWCLILPCPSDPQPQTLVEVEKRRRPLFSVSLGLPSPRSNPTRRRSIKHDSWVGHMIYLCQNKLLPIQVIFLNTDMQVFRLVNCTKHIVLGFQALIIYLQLVQLWMTVNVHAAEAPKAHLHILNTRWRCAH